MTDFDDEIDWYALSNGLSTVMPDGTLIYGTEEEELTGPQADWLRKNKPYAITTSRPPSGHSYVRRGIVDVDGKFVAIEPGKVTPITEGCIEVGVLEQTQDLARR